MVKQKYLIKRNGLNIVCNLSPDFQLTDGYHEVGSNNNLIAYIEADLNVFEELPKDKILEAIKYSREIGIAHDRKINDINISFQEEDPKKYLKHFLEFAAYGNNGGDQNAHKEQVKEYWTKLVDTLGAELLQSEIRKQNSLMFKDKALNALSQACNGQPLPENFTNLAKNTLKNKHNITANNTIYKTSGPKVVGFIDEEGYLCIKNDIGSSLSLGEGGKRTVFGGFSEVLSDDMRQIDVNTIGKIAAKDPRLAATMAETIYQINKYRKKNGENLENCPVFYEAELIIDNGVFNDATLGGPPLRDNNVVGNNVVGADGAAADAARVAARAAARAATRAATNTFRASASAFGVAARATAAAARAAAPSNGAARDGENEGAVSGGDGTKNKPAPVGLGNNDYEIPKESPLRLSHSETMPPLPRGLRGNAKAAAGENSPPSSSGEERPLLPADSGVTHQSPPPSPPLGDPPPLPLGDPPVTPVGSDGSLDSNATILSAPTSKTTPHVDPASKTTPPPLRREPPYKDAKKPLLPAASGSTGPAGEEVYYPEGELVVKKEREVVHL